MLFGAFRASLKKKILCDQPPPSGGFFIGENL
jgi:hypothetical protein